MFSAYLTLQIAVVIRSDKFQEAQFNFLRSPRLRHAVDCAGMSYGMIIAVQLDNSTLFEMLWSWAKLHMRHNDPSDPRYGYCPPSTPPLDMTFV